jgi:hypothetical protein
MPGKRSREQNTITEQNKLNKNIHKRRVNILDILSVLGDQLDILKNNSNNNIDKLSTELTTYNKQLLLLLHKEKDPSK